MRRKRHRLQAVLFNVKAARRLPGNQFIATSLKKSTEIKHFLHTFIWQMWRMPERPTGSAACRRCCAMNEAGAFKLIKCAPAQQRPL
jgi:hypothetical protein